MVTDILDSTIYFNIDRETKKTQDGIFAAILWREETRQLKERVARSTWSDSHIKEMIR